jgi:aspartyl-tRNA(Asn)/glutamyl-tRNA(Gln) amidotransferase subunit C
MARVTPEIVGTVARLASLSLSEKESLLLARQLEDILAWAESLQSIDIGDAEPFSSRQTSPELREDTPGPGLERERVLSEAPDVADGLFRVPRVIGG